MESLHRGKSLGLACVLSPLYWMSGNSNIVIFKLNLKKIKPKLPNGKWKNNQDIHQISGVLIIKVVAKTFHSVLKCSLTFYFIPDQHMKFSPFQD